MKIAILTPILYDETSPFNHLFRDIINGFLNDGNTVDRYVAAKNEADTGYTLGIFGEKIKYFPFIRKQAKKSNIIFRYLFDTLTTIRMSLSLKKSDADILFEDVGYSSFWSVRAAKKRGLRIVAMVQDIWPDNAVAGGIIKEKSLVYKFFELWQKPIYKHADHIICISEDMREYIVQKGVPENKISVIYNWGYTDETVNIPDKENEFIKKYNLSKDLFYAVYAGNIGRMENVELIVEAARLLKDDKSIRFLIVGDGVCRKKIEKMVDGEENIEMFPMQPSSLATHIYSAAGINIIPLVKNGVNTALPSKTGVVLSCGKETVFCFGENCRFNSLLEKHSLNRSISTDKPEELALAIKKAACSSGENRDKYYEFFKSDFTRTANIQKYISTVKGIL